MTDKVHPSFNREAARSRETAAAIGYGGGAGEGFVWPDNDRLVEDSEGDLATGPLDSFTTQTTATNSSGNPEVTLGTGEAIVGGAYLARDTTTTLELPASTTTTISLGWKDGQPDTVLIGQQGTTVGDTFTADDPRMDIWTFTTDASSVTGTTDERRNAGDYRIPADAVEDTSSGNTGEEHFLCYPEDGTYYVKNVKTGTVESSGSDAATQLAYAMNNLPTTDARPVVNITGEWPLSQNVVTQQQYFGINAYGARIYATGNTSIFAINHSYVYLHGGVFDGVNQTDGDSGVRVLNVANVAEVELKDVHAVNAGYYAFNIYQANRCRFYNCVAENAFDDGFHPDSDTAGRNQENLFVGCIAKEGGSWGFNDRMGGGAPTANQYVGCRAWNNALNGIGAWNGTENPDIGNTYTDCVAVGNDKNYKLEDANHQATNCVSYGATTSGWELDNRSNPADSGIHMTFQNCVSVDPGTTGVAWNEVDFTWDGGRISTSLFEGSSASVAEFNDVDGVDVTDATPTLRVDDTIAAGTATLSSGAAVVGTGLTTAGTPIDVRLDPSGNATNVKASARAFWDNSVGEYKVEILEDGTSVGNPDIGYEVTVG